MLETGSLVDGKYRILYEIGHGGMSRVYLALNERANKTWAIKEVAKSGTGHFEIVRQRLIAETNILKKLSHPHLPSIVDVIDEKDSFLVVMDYVEGVSLASLLKHSGAQPWRDVAEWGRQLCDVLAYLHSRRPPIIYRDMKPDNVQLKPDGSVTLLDFGTAREYKYLGGEGSDTICLGTRGYAAPEQYGGMGETDPRTDIYCLGATLYHLLTGRSPGLPPYEMKPIRQIDPALPGGLEYIIDKCTQADPDQRYQSCQELMYDLQHIESCNAGHIRRQRFKLAVFCLSTALTILFGMTALVSRGIAVSRSDQRYRYYYETGRQAALRSAAENDAEYLKSEDSCRAALKIKPASKDVFILLAGLYAKNGDNTFAISPREESAMRTLIISCKLDRNMDAYAEAAFWWGSFLFFYYQNGDATAVSGQAVNGEGSAVMAKVYLEAAAAAAPRQLADNRKTGEARKELACAMSRICKGEVLLDRPGYSIVEDGEEYSYASYWEDLRILTGRKLVESVKGATNHTDTNFLLSMYKHAAGSLLERMTRFGKSRREILAMAKQIREQCVRLQREDPASFIPGSEAALLQDDVNRQLQMIESKTGAWKQGGQ